jgi:amidase
VYAACATWSTGAGMTTDRRRFLRTGLLWNAAAMTASVCPVADAGSAGGSMAHGVDAFEFDEITIAKLQEGMTAGRFSAHSLVRKYLARIKAIDSAGPALHSVIETNPDALAIAMALDRERKERGPRSPLHGIPMLIKDNIDTFDRMATTAGSLALVGANPARDAFLVGKLRAAGAVILGKSNLSEWANIRSSRSSSGWSARGGLTRNPYALDRNTSGSSSGSAAAVAASLCVVAVGTETDGSIVSPSSINGIVGIKPTVGLVSRSGIIPISHTQDTAGPMARTVRDAAILLGALAGADNDDPATAATSGRVPGDYTPYLDARALQGARIGVARNYFGFHDGVDAVAQESLDVLRKSGATLVDPASLPNADKFGDAELLVLLYELKADLNDYLARQGNGARVRSLEEVIAFNERNRTREMPYFGQDLFVKAEAKGPLTSAAYLEALATCRRFARSEGIDAVMDQHKLDALVAPTDGPAWLTDLVVGDHPLGSSSSAAAVAGYPSITVPAGFVSGLPVGISFFGRAWSEPALIGFAYAFEQARAARKAPQFAATAHIG